MAGISRSNLADEDLIDIWLAIAKDDPATADRVLEAIELRWQQLLAYPASGVAREDIGEGIRHLVMGSYLTLYRATGDDIEIVRVLHGRRRIAPPVVPP